jgi:transposase
VHREQLIIEATSQVQQMRDLLDCVWPAVLNCARSSRSGRAPGSPRSLWVVERDSGDLARTRRLGWARFETTVRRLIVKQGRQKPCLCASPDACSPP